MRVHARSVSLRVPAGYFSAFARGFFFFLILCNVFLGRKEKLFFRGVFSSITPKTDTALACELCRRQGKTVQGTGSFNLLLDERMLETTACH